MNKVAYKRILLKVSGEVLMGSQPFGIDLDTVGRVADEIIACLADGTQIALVIGGETSSGTRWGGQGHGPRFG